MALSALSLCSGIGGLDLGLQRAMPGTRTVCYVEGEAYCAGVLAQRMADGWLADAPIWSDVKTFDGKAWRGKVDCITAGYPCQPFSVAGRRQGDKDPRHLWPHVARIIGEVQPTIVFLENVPGHVRLGLQAVCADLYGMGYYVQAGIFSAAEIGALHIRKRLFILAYTDDVRRRSEFAQHAAMERERRLSSRRQQGDGNPAGHGAGGGVAHTHSHILRHQHQPWRGGRKDGSRDDGPQRDVADADSQGRQQSGRGKRTQRGRVGDGSWWAVEPNVGRVADGVAHRLDRLRALGNAVVPATAELAMRTLMEEASHG